MGERCFPTLQQDPTLFFGLRGGAIISLMTVQSAARSHAHMLAPVADFADETVTAHSNVCELGPEALQHVSDSCRVAALQQSLHLCSGHLGQSDCVCSLVDGANCQLQQMIQSICGQVQQCICAFKKFD